MTAEAQKLRREKRELENALSTLKKNSAATQEELSKGSRRLTAELQSVKRENIRLREVRMYVGTASLNSDTMDEVVYSCIVCVCVCVCVCVRACVRACV